MYDYYRRPPYGWILYTNLNQLGFPHHTVKKLIIAVEITNYLVCSIVFLNFMETPNFTAQIPVRQSRYLKGYFLQDHKRSKCMTFFVGSIVIMELVFIIESDKEFANVSADTGYDYFVEAGN